MGILTARPCGPGCSLHSPLRHGQNSGRYNRRLPSPPGAGFRRRPPVPPRRRQAARRHDRRDRASDRSACCRDRSARRSRPPEGEPVPEGSRAPAGQLHGRPARHSSQPLRTRRSAAPRPASGETRPGTQASPDRDAHGSRDASNQYRTPATAARHLPQAIANTNALSSAGSQSAINPTGKTHRLATVH
jgi:hypothetical protein